MSEVPEAHGSSEPIQDEPTPLSAAEGSSRSDTDNPASSDAPRAEAAESGEPASSESSAGAEAAAPEGEGDEGADGEESSAGEETAADGSADAPAGKRKRRRRKKGKGPRPEGEAGEGAAPEEGRGKRRDAPLAPFSRFFTGANAGRKHGFAVGEVVAGRVKSVAHGTITVDLFGKAFAFADEHEPRELPPEPEPPPAVSPKVAAK